MTHSAALFRAANLQILDYPFAAALASALNICHSAVVVVGQSQDNTRDLVYDLAAGYHGRVKVHETVFTYDRMWQENWWNLASSLTDAEWLMYHDADEVIHEDDAAEVRALMRDPAVKLISFPFIHFYMTPNWTRHDFPPRATRLGRRSAGYRMRNWCTDENPDYPACQMVCGKEERDAHGYRSEGIAVMDIPVFHYSWCRDALALQISQAKHVDWYANGKRFGLTDGRVPDAKSYVFEIGRLLESGEVRPYLRPDTHPAVIGDWLEAHGEQWAALEAECTQLV